MRLDALRFADEVSARVYFAARGDCARYYLGAAAAPAQVYARSSVHLRAFARHEDGVECRDGAVAVQIDGRVHLQVFRRLKADVVRYVFAAFFDDDDGARADGHLFGPVVHHREGQRRAFFDVDFGDADVEAGADVRAGCAAGNYAELRAFFRDDDVVNVLRERVRLDVHAGLHREFRFRAFFCAYEVAALFAAGGALCEGVFVFFDELPAVILEAVLELRVGDWHDLYAL